jgi:hypothetical protein
MTEIQYGPPEALLNTSTGAYGMASAAWLSVPVYVSGLLKFPLKDEAFESAYGKITDAAEHKKLVSAVVDAKKFIDAYGDPVTLTEEIDKDADYLQKENPPPEFYAQALWTAYLARSAASIFAARAGRC